MRFKELAFIAVLLLLTALGFLAAYQMHFHPLIPTEPYESALGHPWRLLVVLYVFLVLIGTALIASAGEILGIKEIEQIVKEAIIIAIVTIAVGLITIGIDLERIERANYALIGYANPSSVMYWMIMFYVLELFFLFLEGWFYFRSDLLRESEKSGFRALFAKIVSLKFIGGFFARVNREIDIRFARSIGLLAVITAILAYSNLGALFSANHIPMWHDASNPIYFVLTAIVAGSAMLILSIIVTSWIKGNLEKIESLFLLRKILLSSLLVTSLFLLWRTVIIGYPAIDQKASYSIQNLLFGKFAINFWFLEIFVGIIAPILALLAGKKNTDALFVASFLSLLGIFASRFNFIYAGQTVVQISGVSITTVIHPLEAMFAVGAISLALLLYYIL
ncbi:MAG: NrfD/PsrC family molybdoenzyme membrane anchor subunit, partial [Archaeoglobaceae archaeon]